MCTSRLFPTLLLALLPWQVLTAQSKDTAATAPPALFDFLYGIDDSIPILQLSTNWRRLIRNKMKEEYQDGVLSLPLPDGSMASVAVAVRPRGNTRKQACLYPPIKIKLPKKQLKAWGFSSEKKLKMVVPCQNGSHYESWLLKEALSYHLYELIYPYHLRAKIIRLEAWEKDKLRFSSFAFLVEEEEVMAARLNARVIKRGQVRSSGLDRQAYLRMCFFQYMIGNTDWAVPNQHNLEFLMIPGFERVVPIPYDFDYSGLVNTSYAVPAPSRPISSVLQRHFLGMGVSPEEAREAALFFLSKKEAILGHCDAFTLLDEKSARSAMKYLAGFFEELENEKRLMKVFVTP